uniref:hypothetical protein n=1 Tax=Variovorax sp. GV048 TaxID=3450239 RepID=UPI000D339FA1
MVGYKLSNKELDWYQERINQLMDHEAMDLYEDDGKQKTEDFVSRVYGKGQPEFATMVREADRGRDGDRVVDQAEHRCDHEGPAGKCRAMVLVTHILQLSFGNICKENPRASVSENSQLLLGLLHLTIVC